MVFTTTIIHDLSTPALKISLISPEEPGKSFVEELEERLTPFIPYEKLEQLYFTSGIIFEIIEKYVNRITGQGIYFEGGTEEDRKNFEEWAKKVKLKEALANGIRDIFLAGGAWGENVQDEGRTDIVQIKPLNPKTMDYIREKAMNTVKLMDDGTPEGYERLYRGYKKTLWKKDTIERAGEEVYQGKAGEDCRDRIYYLKLWSLSESYLGYTPLVSAYKDELIRLNIADATGEGAFRGTGIIATISSPEGYEIPEETKSKLEEDLKKVRSKTIFIFPEEIKLGRFPVGDMKDMHLHLDYFTNIVCAEMGMRRELLVASTTRMAGADLESSREEFETDILTLQDRYADEINEHIIKVRAKLLDIDEPPRLVFRTAQRAIKLSVARRRATLARAGLLTYDPELEIKIRDEEGLPHNLLDGEKDSWTPQSRQPKSGEDIEEIVRRVMDEREAYR